MTETGAKKVVTSQELLTIRERLWRPKADAVSLAAETLDDIRGHHREQALGAFGRLQGRREPGAARQRFFRTYPAVHVLATAGVAADHYERGTFWPKLVSIMGIDADQEFQRDWGQAFLDNLRYLGMPTFESDSSAGSRYVGRILIHAGMPTYCLPDYYRILSWKRSQTPGLTPEGFVSWAKSRTAESGLSGVDMPVKRFILYGDEFAVDVADRSFDLLDAVAAGSTARDVLLPQRFCDVAQRLHEQRKLEYVSDSPRHVRATADVQPRLVIDPFGQGLLLRLPPVGDAPDGKAVWIVALDEDTQRVATESLWPGSSEPAPQTDVAISRPVRSASVSLAGREHLQLPLMIIDDTDPMLAFGEDGELIPRGLPLPASRVWLLFPGEPTSLASNGTHLIVTESPLPPRWSGFSLVQVDLSEASDVSVGTSVRTVRKFDAARIDSAAPVQGVRTMSGLAVYAALPDVQIPAGMAKADWDVTLHDSEGDVIARHRVTPQEGPNHVWNTLPRPIVGDFTIRVRGPWGRGASRSFTVVEGLTLKMTPAWRRFVLGGLQSCFVQLRAADGVELSRDRLDFEERKQDSIIRVGAQAQYRSLVITPPHMTVAYQSPSASISPSIRPLPLTREDVLESPGELIVDIGAAAEPSLHVIANGRVLQTLTAHGGRAGVYRFNLAATVDTLRDFAQVNLALSEDGELLLASLRPRTLFTGIELDRGSLEFTNCAAVEGLNAYLFATRAPWREPACVPVTDGRAALPDWLINAGPIRVTARIEDPWVPLPTPDWPQVGESRLVEADGWVAGETAEETAISAFLAGDTSQSVEVIDFGRLWTARALLPALGLGDRIGEIAEAIDTEVYANPAAALAALSGSDAPSETIPLLMIRSRLAWANLADVHEDSAPPWTKRGALPAALLSAADSLWSDEEIEAAIGICGAGVNGLLDGSDPYATAGRIDGSAQLLDQSPDLREQFIRTAGLIPQGLLSADSRVLAAMDFVAQRHDPRLDWLTKNARSVLREAERLLRMIGDPDSENAFRGRIDRSMIEGWHAVPAISIALALAARHASRGHAEATKWLMREQRPWADLAAVVPQLVTIDLIIAELIVGRRAEEMESAQ